MRRSPILALGALLAVLALVAFIPSVQTEPTWQEQVEAVRRGKGDTIELAATTVSATQFRGLRGLTALTTLKLHHGNVSAEVLSTLADLPHLETLSLKGHRIGYR